MENESLLKRRIGIAAGESWMPDDQLDLILGALIPMAVIISLT